MKFAPLLIWATAKPLIGVICLVLGLLLVWAAITGRFGRIPFLERMVGQGVRPKVRRKEFLTGVEQETLRHLECAFPQFRGHCQVSMGALLSPERWLGRNDALWTHPALFAKNRRLCPAGPANGRCHRAGRAR